MRVGAEVEAFVARRDAFVMLPRVCQGPRTGDKVAKTKFGSVLLPRGNLRRLFDVPRRPTTKYSLAAI